MYNLLERETDLEKIFVPVRVNLKFICFENLFEL